MNSIRLLFWATMLLQINHASFATEAANKNTNQQLFSLYYDGGEHPGSECETVNALPKKLTKEKTLADLEGYIGTKQIEFAENNEATIDAWKHYFSSSIACKTASTRLDDLNLSPNDAALSKLFKSGKESVPKMLEAEIKGDQSKIIEIKTSLERLNKHLHSNRKAARALNEKALIDLKNGRFKEAILSLTIANDKDLSDAEIVSNLGFALIKSGQSSAAIDPLISSISLEPGRSSAWAIYAEALARTGDVQKAVAAFNLTYQFSQDREKTKAYIQKLVDENAEANLVKAASTALQTGFGNPPASPDKVSSGSSNPTALSDDMPRFEDYPATVYHGAIHKPKWIKKDPEEPGSIWRDEMGKLVTRPEINFAGIYYIPHHSCGTRCVYYTMTDLSNGRELDLLDMFTSADPPPVTQDGLPFTTVLISRPDSNLLIAQYEVYNEDGSECRERVFLFKEGQLKPITKTRKACREF